MDAPARSDAAGWPRDLLNAIGQSSEATTKVQQEDCESFRNRVQEILGGLSDASTAPQILMAAGSVTHAIEDYNSKTQERLTAYLKDLHALSSALASAESLVIQSIIANNQSLQAVQEQLTQSLTSIKPEHHELLRQAASVTRQLLDTDKLLAGRPTLASAPAAAAALPLGPALDPSTGLPKRAEAEKALQRAVDSGATIWVAMFYVNRMSLTNARFGESVGNQVLLFCSQHLGAHLNRSGDQLFRWSGPGFIAVLQRQDSELAVTTEIQRIVSAQLSRFFETPSRTVFLPMKMTGEAILTAGRTFPQVCEMIEEFFLRVGVAKE